MEIQEQELVRFFEGVSDFLRDTSQRSRHVTCEVVKVYLRRSVRGFVRDDMLQVTPGGCGRNSIDIADIEVNESCRGKGVFRRLIEHVASESTCKYLVVESVSCQLLHDWAARHGWTRFDRDSYYKETSLLRGEASTPGAAVKTVSIETFKKVGKVIGAQGVIDGTVAGAVGADEKAARIIEAIRIVREQREIIARLLEAE